jgi:hypothetical protein
MNNGNTIVENIYYHGFEYLQSILDKIFKRNEVEDLLHSYVKFCPFIRLTEDVKIAMFLNRIDSIVGSEDWD